MGKDNILERKEKSARQAINNSNLTEAVTSRRIGQKEQYGRLQKTISKSYELDETISEKIHHLMILATPVPTTNLVLREQHKI